MADVQQRPKKYSRIIHNPARIPDHHLLYKELLPYFDWFNNINLNNYPSQLSIPQANLTFPLSSSPSYRTVFAPLELRYISPLSPSSSYSSSRQSGNHSNAQDAHQISNTNQGNNVIGSAERDSLPSDALRNLYRLAERVYSHLNVGIDGKSSGSNARTGLHGETGDSMRNKPIESAARPAAREGSVLASGSYSTENQHDLGVGGFIGGNLREPSISDSISSLYSQNTLATSTLVDSDSFYATTHDRDINNAKVVALSAALEKAYAQLEHDRSAREEAENVISALRGEVGLLTGKLERTDSELEAARERESELLSQHQSLNASIHGLRSQVLDCEPAWASALRAEMLASVRDFSSTTAHSFTSLTKDLKHQHHEITQLGERTSKLATSHESSLREVTHGVQRQLSEKLDNLSSKVTSGHEESISSMSWVENTIKNQIPALSAAVMEVKDVVVGMDGRLGEYEASSSDRHAELSKTLHQNAEASSVHYAQTGNLIHGFSDKLQQHITSSAEIVYANVGAKSKAKPEDDNGALQSGQTVVALDALKALFTSSMSSIREAIERQHSDIDSIMAQISSQVEHHETVAKHGEATNSCLEELSGQMSRSNASSSDVLGILEKLQETLAGMSAGTWFEQGAENAGLAKKGDLTVITNNLHHVYLGVRNMSGDGDSSSPSLADLMAQLTDLSTRLASIEVEVQGAATAAVVVEEISTIKSARSLEHQADVAAGERMREAVLGLDEFVRGQLDLVNAALDEQQSRLVSLQTMGKQQSEDTKAVSLIVEENGELLKGIESQGTNGPKASSESINGVLGILGEIKEHVVALQDSDATHVRMLKDAPSAENADIRELCKSMKEQQELLHALPQRVHAEAADRHDVVINKHSEAIALLSGLPATLAQLSKDTHGLKDAVSKLDSELVGGNAAMNERSIALEHAESSIIESVDALGKEIIAIRERLVSLPTPNGTPNPAISEQSAELLAKLGAIMAELSKTRTGLHGDIADSRTHAESDIKRVGVSIDELKGILEKQSNAPNQGIIALRSMIEKQSTDLVAVTEQISSSHTASSTEVNGQLRELMTLTQSISLKEVLEHLRELGVSVTDIRSLIVEEKESTATSSGTLSEIQKTLETQTDQFKQMLKSDETQIGRHEAIVALLDRNHAKASEVYEGIQTHTSEAKETGQENHTAAILILQQLVKGLESYDVLTKDQHAEILKSLKDTQQYLSDKDDKQTSDIHAKLSDLSQSFVELLSSHTFSSQSLREGVTHLGDSNSSLSSKVDKRFNETLDILNRGLDSLRHEMTKEPSQVTSLLVTLQERIRALQAANEQKHQALAESLQDDLSTLHKDLGPLQSIVVRSQENGRLIYLAEESKDGGAHVMEDQLHRLEQLQHSLEGIASDHHCNGCNCRGGYDSSQASPMKQRRNLSQFGSDATGLSPLPYIEQSFDVPSPADIRKEIRRNEEPAKPYTLEEAEDIVVQSPITTADSENADHSEKRTQFSFPRPHSRTGSSSGGPGNASGSASGGAAAGSKKEHHQKPHDDREISNPFELFARRPRKSSHKPSEGSEDSNDAATQQRPRVKSVSTAPGRTSIGSGKSQRGSLLSSALLSTVSDNTVPTTATMRHRTVSGGLHRLSSIFGKHHHHHEDEAHTGEASGSGSKPPVIAANTAANTAAKEATTSHDHEHDDTTKIQEKNGKEGCD